MPLVLLCGEAGLLHHKDTKSTKTITQTWTTGSGTAAYNQSYSYDALGNLTAKAGVGLSYGSNGNATGTGPHQARVVGGQSYSYDANGNLLSGGGRSYTWNATNQPTQITSGGVSEVYRYDGAGQPVERARAGVITRYLPGLFEQDGGGYRVLYPFGDGVIAHRAAATNIITWFHRDHLGSVSVATNAAGQATQSQRFDPWGAVRAGNLTGSPTH